jgi:hypothetical protein
MDLSSVSAEESVSEVSAGLTPRAEEMSADIYRLIVQEISLLRNDQRVLALLEASVAANVTTVLQILAHGIEVEKVHAPAAAEEYARRLAQRGVPLAALLRAYRIGSARFEDWSPGRRRAATRWHCWSARPRRWRPKPAATGGRCSSRRTNPARGPGCH